MGQNWKVIRDLGILVSKAWPRRTGRRVNGDSEVRRPDCYPVISRFSYRCVSLFFVVLSSIEHVTSVHIPHVV